MAGIKIKAKGPNINPTINHNLSPAFRFLATDRIIIAQTISIAKNIVKILKLINGSLLIRNNKTYPIPLCNNLAINYFVDKP